MFPGNLLQPNYPDPNNPRQLIGRSEVERRERYFQQLAANLPNGRDHPLIQLSTLCLSNLASHRPSADQIISRLIDMEIHTDRALTHLTKLDAVRHVALVKAWPRRNVTQRMVQIEQDLDRAQVYTHMLYNDKNRMHNTMQVQIVIMLLMQTEIQQKTTELTAVHRRIVELEVCRFWFLLIPS